jgi:hypothetical protein
MLLFALIRLGFPSAPALQSLNLATYRNSQAHSTKGTPSHPLPDALTCCGLMVSGSISLPSPGFFSPFPRGTSSLSVAATYLALDRGRPCFQQGFSGLAVLRLSVSRSDIVVSTTGLSPSLAGLPMPFFYHCRFSTPRALAYCPKRYLLPPIHNGMHLDMDLSLGSSPFARRYLGNLC